MIYKCTHLEHHILITVILLQVAFDASTLKNRVPLNRCFMAFYLKPWIRAALNVTDDSQNAVRMQQSNNQYLHGKKHPKTTVGVKP